MRWSGVGARETGIDLNENGPDEERTLLTLPFQYVIKNRFTKPGSWAGEFNQLPTPKSKWPEEWPDKKINLGMGAHSRRARKRRVARKPYGLVVCRALRHLDRCLTIQSVNARSKPISCPAFSDSIHLCLRISSRSAWNSRYSEEFFNKSLAGIVSFVWSDILHLPNRGK